MTEVRSKKRQKPHRDNQNDTLVFNHVRFARKLAACSLTAYAGTYMRDHSSVANPALVADSYTSPDSFRHDYLLYNVLRKLNIATSESSELRVKHAFEKFESVECQLADLNHSLTWRTLALNEPEAHRILYRASRKIGRLLGCVNLHEISALSSFSHGATALHKRTEGRAAFKYSFEYPEVTANAARLAWSLIKSSPSWATVVKGLTLVPGNRLTTVPKDSDIDRVIACEPTMNMYIQKGIGCYIRGKLRDVGIDLNDQTKNQRLAREGSLTGALATVDLSAASDSISTSLCRLLLPEQWFELLMTVRSEVGYTNKGKIYSFEKISSMGNGYTFELESMLFWAIAQACEDSIENSDQGHRCSIYGDDIICRSITVPVLKQVLATCGFSLNDDKSFWDGPFRESCGKHYFNGYDVTPFFVREPVTHTIDLIGLCNRLRRWASDHSILDPRYSSLYRWCTTFLPPFWQIPRIPDGYGDGALFGNIEEVLPKFRNGFYKAAVLKKTEREIQPTDKRFAMLARIFHGYGAYLDFLDKAQDEAKVSFWSHTSDWSRTQLRPGEATFTSSVPLPGAYRISRETIRVYEWSAN